MNYISLWLYELAINHPEIVTKITISISIAIGIIGNRVIRKQYTLSAAYKSTFNLSFVFTTILAIPLFSIFRNLFIFKYIFDSIGNFEGGLIFGVFAELLVATLTSNDMQKYAITIMKEKVSSTLNVKPKEESDTGKEE